MVKLGRAKGAAAGAPAAPAAGGEAEALKAVRQALASYAKGHKEKEYKKEIEQLHAESPSHATCLALAKVRVREAVAAARKVRLPSGPAMRLACC